MTSSWNITEDITGYGVALSSDNCESLLRKQAVAKDVQVWTMMQCLPNRLDIQMSKYYPSEVRKGKYWGLSVFLLQYSPLVKICKLQYYNCINLNLVS